MPTTKTKNALQKTKRKARPAKRIVKESPFPSILGKERIRQAVIEVARERIANTNRTKKKFVSQLEEIQ